MKRLITGLTILASTVSFASSDQLGNMFVAEGDGRSSIPFLAGCSDAKEEAISKAKMSCHEAGYRTCVEVETRRMYRRGANPLAFNAIITGRTDKNDGVCGYKSIFEGIQTESYEEVGSANTVTTLYGTVESSSGEYRGLEEKECLVQIRENASGKMDVAMKIGQQEFKETQLHADSSLYQPKYRISDERIREKEDTVVVYVHPQDKSVVTYVNAYKMNGSDRGYEYDLNCVINEL